MSQNPIIQKQFTAGGDPILRTQFVPAVVGTMAALDDDFDSSVGSSTITDPTGPAPSVTILPAQSGWMMTLTEYTDCAGRTPEFTVNMNDYRLATGAPNAPWEYVWYEADDTDPGTLFPREVNSFDNHSVVGDVVTFSNNAPFTANNIRVATKPRWTYTDTVRAFAYVRNNSAFYAKLPSCDAQDVYGTDTADVSDPDNTAPIVALNQHAMLIDDTSSPPPAGKDKLNVVIVLSLHASEDQGNFAGWTYIKRYLEGVGSEFDKMRSEQRLYVIDVNPTRYYGVIRETAESGLNRDANRDWNDNPSPSGLVENTKQLILSDIPRVDLILDWHGSVRLNGKTFSETFGGIFAVDNATRLASHNAFKSLIGTFTSETFVDIGDADIGWAADWIAKEFDSQLGIVVEYAPGTTGYPAHSQYEDTVDAYIQSFNAMTTAGDLALVSTVSPFGKQSLNQSYQAIAASRLNGVLQ